MGFISVWPCLICGLRIKTKQNRKRKTHARYRDKSKEAAGHSGKDRSFGDEPGSHPGSLIFGFLRRVSPFAMPSSYSPPGPGDNSIILVLWMRKLKLQTESKASHIKNYLALMPPR